jgi:hypothetical protein
MTTALAVHAPDDASPYVEMERLDEDAIIAELKGAALDSYVYTANFGNRKVTSLSLAGVREAVRRLNHLGETRIRIANQPPVIEETDLFIQVMVYAEDTLNGGGNWGVKRQNKDQSARGFALEMALSKAQRNALRALIPEHYMAAVIDEFLRSGRVRQIEEPGHGRQTQNAPQTRSDAQSVARPGARVQSPQPTTSPAAIDGKTTIPPITQKFLDALASSIDRKQTQPAPEKISDQIATKLIATMFGEHADEADRAQRRSALAVIRFVLRRPEATWTTITSGEAVQLAKWVNDGNFPKSLATIAPLVPPPADFDRDHYNRKWHGTVKGTKYANEETRHSFLMNFSNHRYSSLSSFLDGESEDTVQKLIAQVEQAIDNQAANRANLDALGYDDAAMKDAKGELGLDDPADGDEVAF